MTTLQQNKTAFNPEVITTSVSAFLDTQIKKMENGTLLTKKGEKYSASAIRGYTMLQLHFGNFQLEYGVEFQFSEVGYNFCKEFQSFLTGRNLSANSIGLILSKFKALMMLAWKNNLTTWNGVGLETPREKTTQVYLTLGELKKLRIAPLTETETKVLDLFMIQCFTGMRYDTLRKFLENPFAYISEYEGNSYITITSDKTKEDSVIPVGSAVSDLITKYNGKVQTFSEEYVNRTLKTIAEKAEITNDVVNRRTEGGVMNERLVSKHTKISTHTARRTLISLMREQNFANNEIILLSGHTSENQMKNYDRSGNLAKVKHLLGNEFFNTKI